MADNQNDPVIVDALDKLRETILEDGKQRSLNAKQAGKADKLLMAEIKRDRRASNRKPSGVTSRVGKRALGGAANAVGGAIGNALGSIPIAGTILRVLGQEFRNARFDKKTYQKSLKQRRKIELKEMDRMAKVKAKLDTKAEEKQERQSSPRTGGSVALNKAVEKLADAALHLEATAISMTPAIQTFHETAERMAEVVETMADDSPQRIRDQQALEYLHAIDYLTQENTAISERNEGQIENIGKDIGTIKWHASRANGSIGRIEKLLKERESGNIEVKADDELKKDIGTIKWHTARINGSTGRMEKLLQKAAEDRLKQLDIEKQDLKLQEKQVALQDEGNAIGIIGSITNLFGGAGTMAILPALAATLGPVLAAAVGTAIGNKLQELIPTNDFTLAINEAFGRGIDRLLAFFGDEDAKARLGQKLGQDNIDRANQEAQTFDLQNQKPDEFATYQEPWQQEYAAKNGHYDRKDRYIMKDSSQPWYKPWKKYSISDPQYQHEAEAKQAELDANAAKLANQSAEVSDAKAAPTPTPVGGNMIAPTQVNNNSTTVTPERISTTTDRTAGREIR